MNHTVAYIPLALVKLMLNQYELREKWINWVTMIQEYDLDVRPTKIFKGQGLYNFLVESLMEMYFQEGVHIMNTQTKIGSLDSMLEYQDTIFYLCHGNFLEGLTRK